MLEDGTGALQLENDSVSGDKNYFINEEYNIQTQSTYADNLDLDAQAGFNTEDTSDDILDFTERNPFGDRLLMFGHFYNQGMRKMTKAVKFLITYKLKERSR